jgi:protein SCO1/2
VRSDLIQSLAILALVFGPVGVETLAHEAELKPVQRREVQIPINDFTLVDQNSREFKFSQLAARVVVVAFAYTTCPDVCPLITAALRQVQSGLTAEERQKVFLLTITTDPEIDSPKILADYSKRYGANLATWSFLTGDPMALQKVWKNFGVGVKRKGRGLVDHTPLTAVVDRQGKMRVAYVGPAPEAKAVLQDVRRFLVK